MKNTLHLIAEDLDHWVASADIAIRCELEILKTKHAKAAEVYERLYPEA